jgi:hypothetical protein
MTLVIDLKQARHSLHSFVTRFCSDSTTASAPAVCPFFRIGKGSVMSDRDSRLFRALLFNASALGALIACDAAASAQLRALTDNRVMVDSLILAGVIVIAGAMYFFERG